MSEEAALCVVCAWRLDCKKKFLHGKEVSFRCPDFTRDALIEKDKTDAEKDSSKNNT